MIDKILRQQGFWFINMQNKISQFLSECDICMKRNVKPAVHPMRLFPSVEGPFVHLVMDFVDRSTQLRRKCVFSRWTEAYPV